MSAVDPEAWRGTPVAPKGPASGRWDGAMTKAVEAASAVRHLTSPNPWVGCVLIAADGSAYAGATSPPGGLHAERHALASAGASARGATLVTTLEPCDHQGRTPPCTTAIIEAGVRRVVIGVLDPDPKVSGAGEARLRAAGIEVQVGVRAAEVERQLMAYLHQRRTGRPWVVAKLAASVDGRTAAPDGTSQWITSLPARTDAHRLRAWSDAVVVGAGTVRADDPSLTVRHWTPPGGRVWSDGTEPTSVVQPRRVVVGAVPAGARVHPCLQWDGPLNDLVDRLGAEGATQVLVEGGPAVAGAFVRAGLVDSFVVYLAPALFGGDDGAPMLSGPGAQSIEAILRGSIIAVEQLGPDVRIDVAVRESA
ncbi:MAG: bifunctional diaminohydroxyphosphoribosylaminopyrimidine deaminase/5-amino-6-(5-phosphoribosylamino)uracil reductase RibD [bacterium]|nr:bifunctional diaminohydroxyphosphoribosylaminopyrimidine deaminase/5-amino-6-(5-phosphoribosylamino)uracil reductase RibD [bacterium]